MSNITLGRTGITVDRNGFGALPIQRIPKEDAIKLLRKAYDGGITFLTQLVLTRTVRKSWGEAFEGIRGQVFLATKTTALTEKEFWKDLETSLGNLKTEYVDLYQFHNPPFCPGTFGLTLRCLTLCTRHCAV